MDTLEQIFDLLLEAVRTRDNYPPGERDRSRAGELQKWERLRAAGILNDESEFQKIVDSLNLGLDYQRDHPLNEIDSTLDAAMVLARDLDAASLRDLAEMTDLPLRRRLTTYATRCAARALANKSTDLCKAGMLAYLLTLDPGGGDNRDVMVSLAPLHVAAQGTEGGASTLFERFAPLVPVSLQDTWRAFGGRSDITLEAFGWRLEQSHSFYWIVQA